MKCNMAVWDVEDIAVASTIIESQKVEYSFYDINFKIIQL